MRELVFAIALLGAALFIVVGVSIVSTPAAWCVGGVELGVWAWLVLGEA